MSTKNRPIGRRNFLSLFSGFNFIFGFNFTAVRAVFSVNESKARHIAISAFSMYNRDIENGHLLEKE